MASVPARAPSRGIWTADDDTAGLLGRPVMARPPIKLMLSLIESCNLRCFHCLGASTARPDLLSGRTASRELVDFIVERILPEIRSLRLGGLGNTEQLLAPELEYFLERVAARPPVDSFDLTTNLSVMTP